MLRAVLKDLFSDIVGGAGITTMSIPFIAEINDVFKIICSIGGAILLFISIRYKILLYKDLKEKQKIEKQFKRKK